MNHVPWNFRSTWLTVCHRPSIVFPVFIVFIVGLAPTMRSAQCALPANRPPNHALLNLQGTWHSLHHVHPPPYTSVPIRTYPYRLCPHHALCAMRSANHTPMRPCATKVQKHMALSMPCAPCPSCPFPCPQYRLCAMCSASPPQKQRHMTLQKAMCRIVCKTN